MLPGTMDQLISMTVHQTCLHMRTMEQLKSILGQQRSRLLDGVETDSISLMEYYFHIYLLVQAALTHFVSGALAGTIGSGAWLFQSITHQAFTLHVMLSIPTLSRC